MTVLVTGVAGFIGSVVARKLLEDGRSAVGFDNLNDAYDPRIKDHRLRKLRKWGGAGTPADARAGGPEAGVGLPDCGHTRASFRFRAVDIADRTAVEEAWTEARPFEAVINLAARAGVRQSVENPWVYVKTNITGALNLLELCRRDGPAKFVLASTSSLYGSHNPLPYGEDADTSRPLSPYAASKKGAETMCHTYHFLHGLDVTVFRYFMVYGPAGRPDMSVFRFVQWMSEGRPVQVFGDGGQSRDFTYVDDITGHGRFGRSRSRGDVCDPLGN